MSTKELVLEHILKLMNELPGENKPQSTFKNWMDYAKRILVITSSVTNSETVFAVSNAIENVVQDKSISDLKKSNTIYWILTDLCMFVLKSDA